MGRESPSGRSGFGGEFRLICGIDWRSNSSAARLRNSATERRRAPPRFHARRFFDQFGQLHTFVGQGKDTVSDAPNVERAGDAAQQRSLLPEVVDPRHHELALLVLPVARRCFLSMLISGAAPLFQIVSATSRPFTLRYRRQHARHHSGASRCGSSAAKPPGGRSTVLRPLRFSCVNLWTQFPARPTLARGLQRILSSWLSGVEPMPAAGSAPRIKNGDSRRRSWRSARPARRPPERRYPARCGRSR